MIEEEIYNENLGEERPAEEYPAEVPDAPTLDEIGAAVEDAIYNTVPDLLYDAVSKIDTFNSDNFFDRLNDSLATLAEAVTPEPEAVLQESDPEESPDVWRETVLQLITEIRADVAPHPLLTTKFEDYTVTEGLLLFAFLWSIVIFCVRMLQGAFSWMN